MPLAALRRYFPPPRRPAGQHAAGARPGGLAWRVTTAVAGGAGVVLLAGWTPGTIGVLTGILTWLAVGLRRLTDAGTFRR
jgi:hypothetical protein